jgi:hypothetical protein
MAISQKQTFWQQHIQAWQNSSLSQSAYCAKHELSLASFGYWRKRVKLSSPQKIIPVVRETTVVGVQLRSPGGWQVALPANVSLAMLRELMASLP